MEYSRRDDEGEHWEHVAGGGGSGAGVSQLTKKREKMARDESKDSEPTLGAEEEEENLKNKRVAMRKKRERMNVRVLDVDSTNVIASSDQKE